VGPRCGYAADNYVSYRTPVPANPTPGGHPAGLYRHRRVCMRQETPLRRVYRRSCYACIAGRNRWHVQVHVGDWGWQPTRMLPRHCERSEAIHLRRGGAMDCFASLAM